MSGRVRSWWSSLFRRELLERPALGWWEETEHLVARRLRWSACIVAVLLTVVLGYAATLGPLMVALWTAVFGVCGLMASMTPPRRGGRSGLVLRPRSPIGPLLARQWVRCELTEIDLEQSGAAPARVLRLGPSNRPLRVVLWLWAVGVPWVVVSCAEPFVASALAGEAATETAQSGGGGPLDPWLALVTVVPPAVVFLLAGLCAVAGVGGRVVLPLDRLSWARRDLDRLVLRVVARGALTDLEFVGKSTELSALLERLHHAGVEVEPGRHEAAGTPLGLVPPR